MSIKEYLRGLSKVTSGLIGSSLSQVQSSTGGTTPASFVARQKPPKPTYPYSTCDYIGTANIGSRELYRETIGTTETTYFNRRMRLRVALFGNYDDDVLSLIEELRNRIYTPQGEELIKTHMDGAGILAISDPTFNSNLLTTDYEEFASIDIDFWIISEVSRTGDVIDGVETTGGLSQESFDQDEPPLTIDTSD